MGQLWLWDGLRGPSVSELWSRLEAYLKARVPEVLESLNPPATEGQIEQAEAHLKVAIPADLKESLRVHNGQSQRFPIVPAEYDPRRHDTVATWGGLLPVEMIVGGIHATWEGANLLREYAERVDFDLFEYDGSVRRDGGWYWMTFVDPGSGDKVGLDLNPADDGRYCQVVSIQHDPPRLLVLAASYRAWFEQLVERYESGRYAFISIEGIIEAKDRLALDGSTGSGG